MKQELVEQARADAALQRALAVSLEMAALAWEDEARYAAEMAAEVRDGIGLRCVRAAIGGLGG